MKTLYKQLTTYIHTNKDILLINEVSIEKELKGNYILKMSEIYTAVEDCDVFITIGTSGHVYPAAGLIDVARQVGAHCIGVNLEPPMNIAQHDEFHHGKAGELLPGLIEKIVN